MVGLDRPAAPAVLVPGIGVSVVGRLPLDRDLDRPDPAVGVRQAGADPLRRRRARPPADAGAATGATRCARSWSSSAAGRPGHGAAGHGDHHGPRLITDGHAVHRRACRVKPLAGLVAVGSASAGCWPWPPRTAGGG